MNQYPLYMPIMKMMKEIKKKNPIHNSFKCNKIKLQINLTIEVKELYNKILKTLKKWKLRRWKDILYPWIRKINIVKWPYFQKWPIDSMWFPSKFQPHIFTECENKS